MLEFKLEGLDELDKALKILPDRIEKRVLGKALRAGGRVLQKRIKELAPKKSRKLMKSIKVKMLRLREKNAARAVVHTESGKNGVWYAHLIEFGVKPHALGKGSNLEGWKKKPGKQKGRVHPGFDKKPFMRPAFDETQQQQLDAIGDALAQGIIEEVSKL